MDSLGEIEADAMPAEIITHTFLPDVYFVIDCATFGYYFCNFLQGNPSTSRTLRAIIVTILTEL